MSEKHLEKLTSFDIIKNIISATLSSYETGTKFYTKEAGDLRERLTWLYLPLENNLIRSHLFQGFQTPFENQELLLKFRDRNQVYSNLCAFNNYGWHLGLTNWGYDYDFEIDSREKFVEARKKAITEARDFLGLNDFSFFKELGKNLPKVD